jgi:hypothetical protein
MFTSAIKSLSAAFGNERSSPTNPPSHAHTAHADTYAMKPHHIKDCHLGDNWKECPACIEQREATEPSVSKPTFVIPLRVVHPWETCVSICDAADECIAMGCLDDEPSFQKIVRAVNSHAALGMKTQPCECCHQPCCEQTTWRGTTRFICNQCFGFIMRWLVEVAEAQRAPDSVTLPHPKPTAP